MGNDNHCHFFFCQLAQYLQNAGSYFRVQCRGWLIKKQHFGLHSKRPCNGNPLLLSTGQLTRIAVLLRFQSYLLQKLSCFLLYLLLLPFLHVNRCICNILQYGIMRKQVEALKYQPEAAFQPF